MNLPMRSPARAACWGDRPLRAFRRARKADLERAIKNVEDSAPVMALQQAPRTVPIVFVTVVDPVGGGLVDSLARPNDN